MPLNCSQLIALACQTAKCPGYTSQAGQLLNVILADLAQLYDFDFERETTTLNIGPGSASYNLPANHLRTREVFYSVNGTIFYLNQIPLEEYDQLFQGPGINNYPGQFAIQIEASPHLIYFWPPPVIPLSVTIRYQPQPTDIFLPESNTAVPWFPNQDVLLKRLTAELMALTDDTRMDRFNKRADERLSKFLVMDDDKEGYAQRVKLDRRYFRGQSSNLKPTKQTGW